MSAAIVTGASSGIGRAAAIGLADAGWWVLATGRDPERGDEVGRALGDKGGFLAADLTEPSVPRTLVEHAVERDGELGLVVNSAADHFLGTLPELEDDGYRALMAINVDAAVRLSREALGPMRKQARGVIINLSSEAGLVAIPNQIAYNVSKAALLMLTKGIAVDHAADGIRAISVCPGTTRTPLVERAIASAEDPVAHERTLASSRPMGRLATADEIAAVIVFAASDNASFITGTELIVDGGFTAT
jgi:NAD(P)-dependent dehydrogenase (short-subunit alcohol dehydrogenase family)